MLDPRDRYGPGLLGGHRVVDSLLVLGADPPDVGRGAVRFELVEPDCTLTRYLGSELAESPLARRPSESAGERRSPPPEPIPTSKLLPARIVRGHDPDTTGPRHDSIEGAAIRLHHEPSRVGALPCWAGEPAADRQRARKERAGRRGRCGPRLLLTDELRRVPGPPDPAQRPAPGQRAGAPRRAVVHRPAPDHRALVQADAARARGGPPVADRRRCRAGTEERGTGEAHPAGRHRAVVGAGHPDSARVRPVPRLPGQRIGVPVASVPGRRVHPRQQERGDPARCSAPTVPPTSSCTSCSSRPPCTTSSGAVSHARAIRFRRPRSIAT